MRCCAWLVGLMLVVTAPAAPWAVELTPALRLLAAARYREAEGLARQVADQADDDALRRDAHVVVALATMCQGGRDNARVGRAMLRELSEDDPQLLDRPICQWALGLSQREEYATARALFRFYQAADGFRRDRRHEWLGRTLVELARTWAMHNDWESSIPNHPVQAPTSPQAAHQQRLAEIESLRAEAAELPGADPVVRQIDLVLAEYLLGRDGQDPRGRKLLADLAAGSDATAARAALLLGRRAEDARRWQAAAEYYRHAARLKAAPWSGQARRRLDDLQRPQLKLELTPDRARGVVRVALRTRNVESIELELRRVELLEWLKQRRGRFVPQALPTSGSLVDRSRLVVPPEVGHAWWQPADGSVELRAIERAGVLVATARAGDRRIVEKRLVLSGDLTAGVVIGTRRAAVWMARADRAAGAPAARGDEESAEAQAWFWIAGAFVPRQLQLTDGVAVFDLPPEAWVMRSRRWLCVVEAGGRLAICRGVLGGNTVKPRPAVVATWGPDELEPGGALEVVGWLTGPGWRQAAEGEVELELRSTLGTLHDRMELSVDELGTFASTFRISENMAGEHLRANVLAGGEQVGPALPTAAARVPRAPAELVVGCDLPAWAEADVKAVTGRLWAEFAWGQTVGAAAGSSGWLARRLETDVDGRRYSLPMFDLVHLGEDGQHTFLRAFEDFGLGDGPLAVYGRFSVRGPDGRPGSVARYCQHGGQRPALWIDAPPEPPRLGEPLELHVGWFDASDLAGGRWPAVEICYESGEREPLPMAAVGGGLVCAPWRPRRLGACEIVARLELRDGTWREVRCPLEIQPGDGPWGRTELHDLSAKLTGGAVRVAAQAFAAPGRIVALLYADGELLDAAPLRMQDQQGDARLTPPDARHGRLGVLLLGTGGDPRVLAQVPVSEPQVPPVSVTVEGPTLPAAACRVRIENPAPVAARVLWRLADRSLEEGIDWDAEGIGRQRRTDWGLVAVDSSGSPVLRPADLNQRMVSETTVLDADIWSAWKGGHTLGVGRVAVAAGQATTLQLRLPDRPGHCWLSGLVLYETGGCRTFSVPLGQTAGLSGTLIVPRRLLIGDRPTLVLRLENPGSEPVETTVSLQAGEGLAAARLRSAGTTAAPGEGLRVTVAPGGREIVLADCEAVRAGQWQARMLVGRQQEFAAAYHVGEATPPAAESVGLRLRRSLWRLRTAGRDSDGQARWERERLEAGEAVSPGTVLLVEESITPTGPLAGVVEWVQEVPGGCRTRLGIEAAMSALGAPVQTRATALKYRPRLRTAVEHEYVMVAWYPGVYRVPPPRVYADGRAVPVVVEPDELLIRVVRPGR